MKTGCRFFFYFDVQRPRNITTFQQVCRRQGSTCPYIITGSQNSTLISSWDLQRVMEQGHMLYFWLQNAASLLSFLIREKQWIHSPTALLQLSWSVNFLSQAFSCHPNVKSGHFLHSAIPKQAFIVMYVKIKELVKPKMCIYTFFWAYGWEMASQCQVK